MIKNERSNYFSILIIRENNIFFRCGLFSKSSLQAMVFTEVKSFKNVFFLIMSFFSNFSI